MYLNLSELHPFKNHPFGVRDDAEMQGLVESVKAAGVNQPALVRPREGGGYEIIAGHRRQRASELAGFVNMPCIVRNMTDDRDAGKRSTQIVGDRNGMNYKQVQRYIRLTELVPDLQKMVDEKQLSFTPAVEISFIRPKHQKYIAVAIEGQASSPSLSQAQKMRELDKEGKLNGDVIDGILSEQKKEVDKVIINSAELEKYFGKDKTPREMKDTILALLDEWKEKQPPGDGQARQEKGYGEVTDPGTICPEVFFVPSFKALGLYPPSPPITRHGRALSVKGEWHCHPTAACPLRAAPAVPFPEV